jgi:glucose-6-phosphate isomerase
VKIAVSGAAAEAVDRVVPQLVSDLVASRLTGLDSSLWGAEADEESAQRLGWTESIVVSAPLVPDILALRDKLRADGVNNIVLGGMGGSSLAPEVITRTYGAELTILDSTEPGQILAALNHRLDSTAVVISSKSGGTVETDSHKRVYEAAFREIGIDPIDRIIVVTDPGSPLDVSARADGYRVFNADPTVGGRFSALTAFGLVPAGLAGVDIAALLREAEAVSLELAQDSVDNPGLVLAAAIAGTRPLKDKLGIVSDGTHIVGFADWAEQLLAESTGKISLATTTTPARSKTARSRSPARSALSSSRGSTRPQSPDGSSESIRLISPMSNLPRSRRAHCWRTAQLRARQPSSRIRSRCAARPV